MRIVCISDTHWHYEDIKTPKGDILVHAGDLEVKNKKELKAFNEWLLKQPQKFKIVIGGNHDFALARRTPMQNANKLSNAMYLQNYAYYLYGLKIWGSPISPKFEHWAFMEERGDAIKKYWDMIPCDTEIVVTHAPPYQILDKSIQYEHCGCWDLAQKIKKVKPKLHIFGHIHEAHGIKEIDGITYINASIVDVHYNLKNKPIVIDI